MGEVYLVRNFRMRETVLAMKVLRSIDEILDPQHFADQQSREQFYRQLRARFYREGEVMAAFDHPHIVRVFSNGMEHDGPHNLDYILMEYIQGKTLHSLLREKDAKGEQLDLEQVLEFAAHITQALIYAHNQHPPVLHRDIKPSNVMIADATPDYPLGRAVVMDWGIAKKLSTDDAPLTSYVMGSNVRGPGTPRYCAPEQMRNEEISYSADVYALGMVLYEMYAGKPFFADTDQQSIIRKVQNDAEENEPRFTRPADPEFVNLVRKAIAKNHAYRYQRAEDFLRDLKVYRKSLPDATPPTQAIQVLQKEEEESELQRKRLEEQQRSLTLRLQAQTKTAYERAVQAGAEEWAAQLLQQGVKQEEEADRKLEDRHYFPAQEAYEQAKNLFDQARGKALTVAMQKAEEARQAMLRNKSEAERYGARERAPRFRRDGLLLEDKAREFEEVKQYRQAMEMYERAAQAFADARDRAHDAFQEEIEAQQAHVSAEREAARGDGAEELAAELFSDALRSEQQAATALAHDELTRAYALYSEALQKYEQAHQQARLQQQRQAAALAQQRAEEARIAAESAGAERDATQLYRQAQEQQYQGNSQFEIERYADAAQHYEQARQHYEQAVQEAEREQKNRVDRARRQLAEAQAAIPLQELDARLPVENGQVRHLITQAQASERQKQFTQAAEYYLQAAKRFEELRHLIAAQIEQERRDAFDAQRQGKKAQHAAEQAGAPRYAVELFDRGKAFLEEAQQFLPQQEFRKAIISFKHASTLFAHAAGVARQEQGRATAEAARLRMEQARAAADHAKATPHFAERFAQTESLAEQGRRCEEGREFERATQWYERATQEFEQLQQDAAIIAARAQADIARQGMEEEKAGINSLAEWRGRKWTEAEDKETAASQAWNTQDYVRAAAFYEEAKRSYQEARVEAEEQREQQRALAAQQAAQREHTAAVAVDAALHAASLFADGSSALQQGEQRFAARQWSAAVTDLLRAQELFAQARQEAQQQLARLAAEQAQREAERARLRRIAEEARQQAIAAKADAEAAEASQYAAELFAQGVSAQEKAEHSLFAQDFDLASQQYQQARELFHKAASESQQEQEKRALAAIRAVTEQNQAAAAQAKVADRFPADYARAQHLYEQGRHDEERRDLTHARQRYEEAARSFADLRSEALRQKAKDSITAARQYVEELKQRLAALSPWLGDNWSKGQQLEAEAERAWRAQEYERAAVSFAQVGQIYEGARDEAEQRRIRQLALEAQQQAHAAQRRAEALEALRHNDARPPYQRAVKKQEQGTRYLARSDWEQATKHFTSAAQLFGEAAALAQRGKERQAALAALQKCKQEEQAAAEAGAAEHFQEEFSVALTWVEQGQACETHQEFAQARTLYYQAAEKLAQLRRQAVLQAARKKAEAVRQQFLAVRDKGAHLREWAAPLWSEAQQSEQQAEHAYREGQYALAAELYEQARLAYERAAQAAEREQVQQEALQAKRQALTAKAQAEGQEARRYASQLFAQGEAALAEAEQCLSAGDVRATKTYQLAQEQFAQAAAEAEQERAKQRAATARAQAIAAHRQAEEVGAAQRFVQEFASARQLLEKAQQQETNGSFTLALKTYERATQQFLSLRQQGEAQRAAEREQRRQQAMEARQQAEHNQVVADEAQGRQYAANRYQQAVEAKQQGEQEFSAENWEAATAQLLQAAMLFAETTREAQRVRSQRMAEAARIKAAEARQGVVAARGGELFPQAFTEATRALREAEETFAQETFGSAQALFEKSTTLFQQILQDVATLKQQREAERAKASALALQQQVHEVKPRKKRRAEQALAAAEQLYGSQRYVEAQQKYQEAISLLNDLLQGAPTEVLPPPAPPAPASPVWRRPTVLLGAAAALAAAIVIAITVPRYFSEPIPSQPSVEVTPAPAPSPRPPSPPLSPTITITQASPDAPELSVAEGDKLAFAVEAKSSSPKSLRYAWFLDDVKKAEGKQWTYQPDFEEGGDKPKEIKVVVTDGDAQTKESAQPVSQLWRVRVQNVNRPPIIVAMKPEIKGIIEASLGQSQKFIVQASDPDGDPLTYEWRVDEQE
ncbi:MAG TPA: protein kinase, partial [Methylomirabilota bacterium]|nr:protein kinase [Methylomirabilota bacterium]